jgi:hypothetical protein
VSLSTTLDTRHSKTVRGIGRLLIYAPRDQTLLPSRVFQEAGEQAQQEAEAARRGSGAASPRR